jgi:hypothetical protein
MMETSTAALQKHKTAYRPTALLSSCAKVKQQQLNYFNSNIYLSNVRGIMSRFFHGTVIAVNCPEGNLVRV